MELVVWPRLNHRSKMAMRRKKKNWGWNYTYSPKFILIDRLSQELGMTHEQVRRKIEEEREYILRFPQYY